MDVENPIFHFTSFKAKSKRGKQKKKKKGGFARVLSSFLVQLSISIDPITI